MLPNLYTDTKTHLAKYQQPLPHSPETQQIGEEFVLAQKSLVLKVPSAIVQGDFNYLINPIHPGFSSIKIIKTELFSFD